MATYEQLRQAEEDSALKIKVRIACAVAAVAVADEADTVPNHVQRLKWAKWVFENPDRAAEAMLPVVIAKNRAATFAQIIAANDAGVQAAVDGAVNVFSQGFA